MQMLVRVGGSRLITFPSRTPLAALGTHLKFVIMNLKVKPVGPVCGFFPATFSCLGTDMRKRDNLVSQNQGPSFLVPSLRYLSY